MNKENTEKIRSRVLSLIESQFESDAAFERALSLKEKTVNNWRRGRSASFTKMLPTLSERFGVNVGELLDIPLKRTPPSFPRKSFTFFIFTGNPEFYPEKCVLH